MLGSWAEKVQTTWGIKLAKREVPRNFWLKCRVDCDTRNERCNSIDKKKFFFLVCLFFCSFISILCFRVFVNQSRLSALRRIEKKKRRGKKKISWTYLLSYIWGLFVFGTAEVCSPGEWKTNKDLAKEPVVHFQHRTFQSVFRVK